MNEVRRKIKELEGETQKADFWRDKAGAQKVIKEISALKNKLAGTGKYDKGDAVLMLFAGAGGDDAEDWTRVLFDMYSKFAERKGWQIKVLHEHKSELGGYKNITFDTEGKNAYGTLKNEAGVHRLVRVSPFSAKKLRHTSFALLEVVPKFIAPDEIKLDKKDIRVEFAKSSGPGGQNVNKRETAVRVVHLPTNLAAHVSSERSQAQNRDRALEILKSKLYKKAFQDQEKEKESMRTKNVEAEWGHQIRSYVLHPYKMVKDHRTNMETTNINAVLEGKLDEFIEAEKNL